MHHDVSVIGGGLTGNEVKAIRKQELVRIPVKVGGGYKFIFTDAPNNKGEAVIYPETFGSGGIETTFEVRRFEDESETLGCEVAMGNEKRLFIIGNYKTRAILRLPVALKEDVTGKVQAEYPKAEQVYTFEDKVY